MAAHARSVWRRPLAWIALALAVLAASGVLVVLLDRSADAETRSSFQWTTHTLEVENELARTLAAIVEAESAQRGYIISGDTVYLAPYADATFTARKLLGSLRRLTSDNAAQQRRLDTLDRLVDARLARLRTGVMLMTAGQRDSVEALIRNGSGRLMMDSVRATVRDALDNEGVLLNQRQRAVEDALEKRRNAEVFIIALAVLAMVLASVVSLRLQHAERLVTMCAWSKAIELDGEWMSFEAYMARRFGIAITHGISPVELRRLEAEMESGPVIASTTAGVARR
jgi:methyl-accepting chemotaxis protein